MEDTTQTAQDVVRRIVMAKTTEERFLMCAQMYEDAKEFAKIGMPEGLSPEEREAFIFEKIHGAKPEEII